MKNKKIPTVKQYNWLSIFPQIIFMLSIMLIFRLLNFNNPIIWACITYLIISVALRSILTKEHKKGIQFTREQNFTEAIHHFKNSAEYFKKNSWLDRYRFITLLSSSNMSYREMALNNIAFCYSQIGDGKKSKEYYEKTLSEFPNSIIAKTALNFFEAAKNNM